MRYIIVIDFHEYLLPNGDWGIKEWSLSRISPNTPVESQTRVTRPPLPWDELESCYKNYYNKIVQLYGVKWRTGDVTLDGTKRHLIELLSKASLVYTRSANKKYILIKFLNTSLNIKPLDTKSDYHQGVEPPIDCRFHIKAIKKYCAAETVRKMLYYLKIRATKLSRMRINSD
ncbi:MdBV-1-1 [Microplitis demolitor]|nr:MdBV-1-1 [Microplitis demolitor]